jgi:hypothetical protein
VVRAASWPITLGRAAWWQAGYMRRRWQNLELNDDERTVLTQRAVGPIVWETSSEEDRESLMQRELWVKEHWQQWQEEQEIKNLSTADQKAYYKSLKKQKTGNKAD